ncbi:sulfatase family protein [Membranihabitans maritimus]|uniref:sulfatase family protein n=1 Tax=Membranihabitans maritimus TaxID=2904244 RepID=UPI001F24011A|nr:sulfatase [Membranihabitans maritimus]
MRGFQFLWLPLLVFFILSCQSTEQNTEERKKPNIIFIMTDDHAFQAISAYGSELIQTPNIDKLAQEGMLFDRAYVTNSICAPSRAVVLTGKHSHLNGLTDNAVRFDSTQVTLPRLMQEGGYKTAVIGKWHLKTQPMGFDYWKVLPGQGHYYNPEFRTQNGRVVDTGYVTDLITDFSLEWLDENKDGNQPFMLMYQHKAPHREWLAKPKYFKEFTQKEFPVPSTLFDNYENRGNAAREAEMRIADHMGLTNDSKIKPEIAEELGHSDFMSWYTNAYRNNLDRMNREQRSAWDNIYDPINKEFKGAGMSGEDLTRWKYQRYMQDYLASIASVDENIGRLMDYLKENNLEENTVVIYTSDQGFYLGEHGWFDKRFMYEESFRTPLIIKWPGVVKPGSINSDLVQNLDFAETILDMAGNPIPDAMQGSSLVPLLKGEKPIWRKALYYHYYEYPGIHAVKRHIGAATDRYKIIHFYNDIDEWELYDLQEDPQEMYNVYGQEEYAEIQTEMHEILLDLARVYEDSVGLEQAQFK